MCVRREGSTINRYTAITDSAKGSPRRHTGRPHKTRAQSLSDLFLVYPEEDIVAWLAEEVGQAGEGITLVHVEQQHRSQEGHSLHLQSREEG